MRRMWMLLAVVALVFCKRDNTPGLDADNLIKANVMLSSGQAVTINATGVNAKLQCVLFGTSALDAKDISNRYFRMAVARPVGKCVETAGTYAANVDYRPDVTSVNSPIYSNNGISDSTGTITYTIVRKDWVEGHFNVKGYYQNDSVVIAGTFKGHLEIVY